MGLNAAVFREAQQADSDRGRYRALWAALWVLLRYRPPRMVLHLDDRVLDPRACRRGGERPVLRAGVYRRAGRGDRRWQVRRRDLLPLLADGVIRHFASIAFGRRRYSAKTATYRSSRARIGGVHPLPCRADGHDLGSTPVEYVARPGALRVVAPPRHAEPR